MLEIKFWDNFDERRGLEVKEDFSVDKVSGWKNLWDRRALQIKIYTSKLKNRFVVDDPPNLLSEWS